MSSANIFYARCRCNLAKKRQARHFYLLYAMICYGHVKILTFSQKRKIKSELVRIVNYLTITDKFLD